MNDYRIKEVWHERGEVRVKLRYWDGIDHPDYRTLEGMSPSFARTVAGWLLAAAFDADNYKETEASLLVEKLQQERKSIDRKIAELTANDNHKLEACA